MTAAVTHLLRCPIVGGSELETLAIIRALRGFRHRVVFPERFAAWDPSIRGAFAAGAEVVAVPDVEQELERRPPRLLHIQFPFLLVREPAELDSVLELRHLPPVPTLFTVHAAINVPVVPDVHYLFHTRSLAARFAGRIAEDRITVCPSLVEPPPMATAGSDRRRGDVVRLLWVSRNEAAKFHADVPRIVQRVLDAAPHVQLRFVGWPPGQAAPAHERVSTTPCPVPDVAAEYRSADLFWYFPDPRLEETWCRVVTEAMWSGLPCVVAAHGAMVEQVEDGTHGRVVASAAQCVDAIVDLAADPARRAAMGAAARRRAATFFSQTRATLASLYARHLGEPGRTEATGLALAASPTNTPTPADDAPAQR